MTEEPKVVIAVKVPESWKNAIKDRASIEGIITSKWLIRVLGDALGFTEDNSVNPFVERLSNVEENLKLLNDRVNSLEKFTSLQVNPPKLVPPKKQSISAAPHTSQVVKPPCPQCGDGNPINKGIRSGKRRWQCKVCAHNWCVPLGQESPLDGTEPPTEG